VTQRERALALLDNLKCCVYNVHGDRHEWNEDKAINLIEAAFTDARMKDATLFLRIIDDLKKEVKK